MADSLLHQLLLDKVNNFTEADWTALDADKKRLLLSELYHALNADPLIMPLLVNVILQRRPVLDLLDALGARIRVDFNRIP